LLDLCLCHACTTFFSPKISEGRGDLFFTTWRQLGECGASYFHVQRPGVWTKGFETFKYPPVKVFSWWDIRCLVDEGALSWRKRVNNRLSIGLWDVHDEYGVCRQIAGIQDLYLRFRCCGSSFNLVGVCLVTVGYLLLLLIRPFSKNFDIALTHHGVRHPATVRISKFMEV